MPDFLNYELKIFRPKHCNLHKVKMVTPHRFILKRVLVFCTVLIFVFIGGSIDAQADSTTTAKYIKAITNYRDEILCRGKLRTEQTEEFIMQSVADVTDLIYLGVVNKNYPYIISTQKYLLKELKFLEVKDGESIADVGAGNGGMGIILSIMYDSLDLMLTEIDKQKAFELNEKVLRTKSIKPSNKITVYKSSKKSTHLEGLNLDKIVLRRTLHHFRHKGKMLESIKRSMKRDGELIILEVARHKTYYNCSQAMTIKKIKKTLNKNGFELVEEVQDKNRYFLRYKIISDNGKV